MKVLPQLYKLSPWFDLDLFYAEVNFVTEAFEWEKVKIIYFLETIAALGLKLLEAVS